MLEPEIANLATLELILCCRTARLDFLAFGTEARIGIRLRPAA